MAPYANQIRFLSSSPTSETATINDSNFTVLPKMHKDLLEIWSDRFFIVCGALTCMYARDKMSWTTIKFQLWVLLAKIDYQLWGLTIDCNWDQGEGDRIWHEIPTDGVGMMAPSVTVCLRVIECIWFRLFGGSWRLKLPASGKNRRWSPGQDVVGCRRLKSF